MGDISNLRPQYSFNIKINDAPAMGISTEAAKAGDKGSVIVRGFIYDSKGYLFFNSLEHIAQLYLNKWLIQQQLKASAIDNCLIQISPDNDIWVNVNCPTIMEMVYKQIPKTGINKGDPITRENIADIRKINLPNIEFIPNYAKIYFFSIGWRRGIFVDFSPLHENFEPSDEQIETSLATCYAFLMFPEIVDIYPRIKDKLFEKGWFPFVRILGENFKHLANMLDNNLDIVEAEKKIVDSFDQEQLLSILDKWMLNPVFKEHDTFLIHGINEYLEGDLISSAHILYPRIEGLLRYIYAKNSGKDPKTPDLRANLKSELINKTGTTTLLLPLDFDDYLKDFYFRNFSVPNQQIEISRHSIAHGVIQTEKITKTSIFQAIMILDQINYYV